MLQPLWPMGCKYLQPQGSMGWLAMPGQHTSPVPSPGRHHVLHAPMCVVTTQGYATCSLQVRGDHFGTDEPRPGLHRWMAGLKQVSWTQTCLWPFSSLHPCLMEEVSVPRCNRHEPMVQVAWRLLFVYMPLRPTGKPAEHPFRANGVGSPVSLAKKPNRLSTSSC